MGRSINTQAERGEGMMEKLNISITEEMKKRLELERKKRALDSIPETIRYILSEYLAKG
ncbi:MAG TPA: ribbon-helix-helix protein, CopG family [Candidatus Bathyarchaeia archaeon]|nr:ribbon-helix-helix protein, CopG family [Candidatus Bathyarchaeia archaeon]